MNVGPSRNMTVDRRIHGLHPATGSRETTLNVRIRLLACAILIPCTAWAGPPFVTDDPAPVEEGHWEVYGFSAGTRDHDERSGTLFGIDANYGIGPDAHLHVLVTQAMDKPPGERQRQGLGDIELGMKYRVFDPGDDQRWPQIAIYPAIDFPTGNDAKGLGSGRTHAFLPVWLQWHRGPWTTYGGAGYWINPGAGNRNYWFVGWQLQRQLAERFAVGAELFHNTADKVGEKGSTNLNLGGMLDLSDNYHLLISVGSGIRMASTTDTVQYYLGLQWTK